eukprot:scaffold4447_cov120-Cylindrotheca_fusiformis.AAC.2
MTVELLLQASDIAKTDLGFGTDGGPLYLISLISNLTLPPGSPLQMTISKPLITTIGIKTPRRRIMSLQCLAILGNKNEPLFFTRPPTTNTGIAKTSELDSFGFLESMAAEGSSVDHELIIHAAVDRMEELIGPPNNSSLPRQMRGSQWIGSICMMEDCEVYGYVTSSNVKILALIKQDEIIPLQKRNEGDIRMLFRMVHDCYVKYTMNPFTSIRSKIEKPCSSFEKGVGTAIKKYNNAVQIMEDPTVRKFQRRSLGGGGRFGSGGGGGGGGGFFSLDTSSPSLVMK